MIKLKNVIAVFKDQLPLKRMYRNFVVTGNARGALSKRSHLTAKGKKKVMYNTQKSARRSADSLGKKNECYYSAYKCLFCDGYHLGRNRDSKK